ncbi:MAG: hypothetical protein E8G75_01005 [Sulfitobacter sp. SK025]|nr:MAG: hypothetical protein E8G75_01005 [Sulfitobacter sp. SK025]
MAWRMYRFPDGLGPVGCDETDTLGYCGLVGKPDVPYFLWKLDDELTPEPADTAIDTIPAGEWDIATKAAGKTVFSELACRLGRAVPDFHPEGAKRSGAAYPHESASPRRWLDWG